MRSQLWDLKTSRPDDTDRDGMGLCLDYVLQWGSVNHPQHQGRAWEHSGVFVESVNQRLRIVILHHFSFLLDIVTLTLCNK